MDNAKNNAPAERGEELVTGLALVLAAVAAGALVLLHWYGG